MARRDQPSKYQPLADYLAALPPETEAVTLTFPAIEALLGAPLPRSAVRTMFWTNARQPRGSLSQVRAVQGVGWRIGGVRWAPGGGRAVTFVRAELPAGGAPDSR